MNAYEEYMRTITVPMRQQLLDAGFQQLTTAEEVHEFMATAKGISLVVINSVCGCAAGLARPAVIQAIQKIQPDNLVTVFAGQDSEATQAMRSYFVDIPPSSPSIAILQDGELAYFIPRDQIEGYEVDQIKQHIIDVFKQLCKK